jgi:hypothetical protein
MYIFLAPHNAHVDKCIPINTLPLYRAYAQHIYTIRYNIFMLNNKIRVG